MRLSTIHQGLETGLPSTRDGGQGCHPPGTGDEAMYHTPGTGDEAMYMYHTPGTGDEAIYHPPGTGDRAAIHQRLEIGLPSSTRELPSAFAQGHKYIVHVHVSAGVP